MKLRAKITKRNATKGNRMIQFVFPAGSKNNFIREAILQRNLGFRPYSEATMWTKEGERVDTYFSRN